jgi:hypothetical protein
MMTKRSTAAEPLVFFAGAWFAFAFSLPLLSLWARADDSISYFLIFVFLPALIAFLCGEGLGSDILYPNRVRTGREAARAGVKVAFAALLFFAPLAALGWAVHLSLYERDPHEWLTIQFVENLINNLFYFGFYGFLVFFWPFAAIGAVAGWLLFKFRLFRDQP